MLAIGNHFGALRSVSVLFLALIERQDKCILYPCSNTRNETSAEHLLLKIMVSSLRSLLLKIWGIHGRGRTQTVDRLDLLTATAWDLQGQLTTGRLTSVELVKQCLEQIKKHDEYLHAVLATSPVALVEAEKLDRERRQGELRGPLHGIPILVKV